MKDTATHVHAKHKQLTRHNNYVLTGRLTILAKYLARAKIRRIKDAQMLNEIVTFASTTWTTWIEQVMR